jgi:hypothetical protein
MGGKADMNNPMNTRRLVIGLLASLLVGGCSEQQPLMTMTQQKSYNECMSNRWSGAADTFVWGPFGWAYYNSVRNDCIAKSGAVGSEEVTAGTSRSDQPVPAGQATTPSATPNAGPVSN